jgi:membrane-bound ClpP family serine protease
VIGVGIALIVLGVVFLFIEPWVGIVAGVVGILLAFLWIAGISRPSADRGERMGSDRA